MEKKSCQPAKTLAADLDALQEELRERFEHGRQSGEARRSRPRREIKEPSILIRGK